MIPPMSKSRRGGTPEGHPRVCASAEESALGVARVGEVGASAESSELERRDFELETADVGLGQGRGFLFGSMYPRLSFWAHVRLAGPAFREMNSCQSDKTVVGVPSSGVSFHRVVRASSCTPRE